MVDLHCHILPGLDDGARDIGETIEMLKMEAADGINRIAATPHFHSDRISLPEFLDRRSEAMDFVGRKLASMNMNVQLIPAAEVRLSPDIINLSGKRELCYRDTNYMLLELPMEFYAEWIPDVLYTLKLDGIIPVIAHVERYPYIVRKPQLLYKLLCSGAVAQFNAADVLTFGSTRNTILRFIRCGMCHVISSDAHSVKRRPPEIGRAMEILRKKCGSDFLQYLNQNSESIIANEEIDFDAMFDPGAVYRRYRD